MLAALDLPVPLGGTSNHFRTEVRREIGGWDSHNVTEDADLGIRLARYGYSTGILAAATNEEANCALVNWMKQRSRWLKGWLQTWLVHMRDPVALWRELGLRGFLVVQATMFGVFFSALVHPFFTAWVAYVIASGKLLAPQAGLIGPLVGGFGLAVLGAGYGVAALCARKGLRRLYGRAWAMAILTMPVYWLLISVAAWLALWEFMRTPFQWNKTSHGLSRFRLRPRGGESKTL